VPENWVEIEGDSCVMKRDYVATELAVDVGEVLTPEFEESGWAWATKESGGSGWVPSENFERLQGEKTVLLDDAPCRTAALYGGGGNG